MSTPSSLLPKIRPATEAKKIQTFIKKTIKATKRLKAIVATSGGIDSAVTLALTAKALGPANVISLKMPYNKTQYQAMARADQAIKAIKIPKRNQFQVNIGLSVERIWKSILIKLSTSQTGQSKLTNQIRLGNIMARVRMIYLFDMSKARQSLIIGTENYSEHLLGYYTRFGDEASDVEPLKHLYKTQVRQLAKYLKLPDVILNTPPSAGLWEDQTDEEELGFSYRVGDQILYLRLFKKFTPIQIASKLHKQAGQKSATYWKRLVKKVLTQVENQDFKHHLPYQL